MTSNASMTCCSGNECAPSTNDATRVERTPKTTFRPAVDVLDGEDVYRIVADLPGASADSVNITYEDGELTLEAEVPGRTPDGAAMIRKEYGVGAFQRRFRVHGEIEPDAITASFADGVLTLTLPKASRTQRRRVPVNAN